MYKDVRESPQNNSLKDHTTINRRSNRKILTTIEFVRKPTKVFPLHRSQSSLKSDKQFTNEKPSINSGASQDIKEKQQTSPIVVHLSKSTCEIEQNDDSKQIRTSIPSITQMGLMHAKGLNYMAKTLSEVETSTPGHLKHNRNIRLEGIRTLKQTKI